MTLVKRAEFARRLKEGPPPRLLLLAGPDESASRELAAEAIAALGDPSDLMALADLSADALRSDPGRLADEAASVSMFGSRRVIRVTAAGEGAADAVRLLLQAPAAGNPVVMVAGDLPKTSGLRKLAEAHPLALAVISYAMTTSELDGWLARRARGLGLRLESGVAERLIATSGGDTAILASELEKFALFLDSSAETPRTLERGHLAALGADSAEEDMNLLVMALLEGRTGAAERQLRLLAGSSAIPVLRALARRLLQLAEARAAVDAGAQPQAAVRALRPPIFFKEADAFAACLPRWPAPRIARALSQCLEGERAIKQAGGPGDTAGWHALLAVMLPVGKARESA
jgi:DNA polymerase-3 subunit delta